MSIEIFDHALAEVVQHGHVSATSIKTVVETAMAILKDDARVVSHVYRSHKSAAASRKLGSLYAFDALAREARSAAIRNPVLSGPKDGTAAGLIEKLESIVERIVDDTWANGKPEQRPKIRKVLNIWAEAKTFDKDLLSTLIAKADALSGGASGSPAPSASASASGHASNGAAAGHVSPNSAREAAERKAAAEREAAATNAQVAAIIALAQGKTDVKTSIGSSTPISASTPAPDPTPPPQLGALLEQLAAQAKTTAPTPTPPYAGPINGRSPLVAPGFSPAGQPNDRYASGPLRRPRSPEPPIQRNVRPRHDSPPPGRLGPPPPPGPVPMRGPPPGWRPMGPPMPPIGPEDLVSIKFDPVHPKAWGRLHQMWLHRTGYDPSMAEMEMFIDAVMVPRPGNSRTAPVFRPPVFRGGPPMMMGRGGPPMMGRGGPPMMGRGGPPMPMMRGGPPMMMGRGGPMMPMRGRGGPMMRGGPPPMGMGRGQPFDGPPPTNGMPHEPSGSPQPPPIEAFSPPSERAPSNGPERTTTQPTEPPSGITNDFLELMAKADVPSSLADAQPPLAAVSNDDDWSTWLDEHVGPSIKDPAIGPAFVDDELLKSNDFEFGP